MMWETVACPRFFGFGPVLVCKGPGSVNLFAAGGVLAGGIVGPVSTDAVVTPVAAMTPSGRRRVRRAGEP